MRRHKAQHLQCADIASLHMAIAEAKKRIIRAGGTILDVKVALAPSHEGASRQMGIVLYAIEAR